MPERVDALQELYCPSELVCAGGLEIKPTGPFIVQVAISLLKSKGLEALNQSLEVASNRTVQQPWFNASDIASIDSKVTEYCRNNGTEAAVNGYYGKKHDFETYIPGPFIRGRSLFQLTEDQSSQVSLHLCATLSCYLLFKDRLKKSLISIKTLRTMIPS